ncbi:ryanodine receptor-like, partial [Diaphorina citri]|uniref:Ryanodine receptor-like n=1 Tax=Diaphorina citri TaxID=121845 RepID=A0A1S4ER78_DIACI
NVVNGTIGKQMVDTLVESAANVELILKYFDMFLKLKDLTSSASFMEIDINNEGWVYPKDFKEKMEQQKSYTPMAELPPNLTEPNISTTVNVCYQCTVDYLLRPPGRRYSESIMDFYWHYSSKELIDPAGKANFFKAIGVASQVFNTLSEVIQGPCTQNQQALAHSRLWDAVGGFLFLFSHMQDKLSKHSSQVDLLKILLNLQKDMITMMLSMLEGNVVNGTIGKQMVDTLVESAANVELILKYFDMFLKLKDLTSSASFMEIDINNEGWVYPKDFKEKMEQQKSYTPEDIEFMLACCETNHDGKIDYVGFTDRFHEPAKEIGFNLAVLLTNLSEHMPNEPRLAR